jgi:hypothetical protein
MAAYAGTDLVATPRAPDLLFCPFCRDCFEGTERCPDHELKLVPWEELPKGPDEPDVTDTDALAPVDPRFGRAELYAGAALLLAGFVAPLFTVTSADVMSEPRTFTALAAAADQAPNLWTLPFVGVIALSLALRRRTPREMRGARLAALVLSLAVPASLAYTLYKVFEGAAQMTAERGYTFAAHLEWGVALPSLASIVLVIGSLRFGVLPAQAPHGPASADPEPEPIAVSPTDAATSAEPPASDARRRRRRR